MSAPSEGWTRLGETANPIDADPEGVKAMGQDWGEISETVSTLCDTAKRTQDSQDMQSDAFDETKKKGQELTEKLADYTDRYARARDAANLFYSTIDEEIRNAESAAQKAAQLDKLNETESEEGSDKASPTSEAEAQKALLAQYKKDLQAAVDEAEHAAKVMEKSINEAKKIGKDSCMDKFKAFLKKILKILMIIGMVLSVIGLLIPGLNVVMIAALVVDIMSMVFTAVSMALGQSTVLDLVMSVFAVGMGIFGAFRSLKGLKVDAAHEGYAGVGKLRNGTKAGSGGQFARPIEMPSWSRSRPQAVRDAQTAARRPAVDALESAQAAARKAEAKLGRVTDARRPPEGHPARAAFDAKYTRDVDEFTRRRDAAVERVQNAKSGLAEANTYANRLGSRWSGMNSVNYFFTKDWMRVNRFSGRVKWLASGAKTRGADEVMTSAGGAPKAFPKSDSVWSTLRHGFLDRISFRESRSYYDDVKKFAGRADDSALTAITPPGRDSPFYFKADGRVVRDPLGTVDSKNPGLFLNGATNRPWYRPGNHDYLLAINTVDSARKMWGLVNTGGQMWEYGSPQEFFSTDGTKTRLTPWNAWAADFSAQHLGYQGATSGK